MDWGTTAQAVPGVLDGVANIMYAEKGIPNGPVTYVQSPQPSGYGSGLGGNNMLIYAGIGIVAVVLLIVLLKK